MSMTKREQVAKQEIINLLYKEGYRVYGNILKLFDLHLTTDPNVVGYMIPDKAEITINSNLSIEQVSMVIRHEILHEYLDHKLRISTYKPNYNQNLANMAGDYEISNVGYTDKDKFTAKHLRINGTTLEGLVTDIDHPEWVNLTLEQIYDKLEAEMDNYEDKLQDDLKNNYSKDFIDGWNDFIDKFNNGTITDIELEKIKNQLGN